MNIIHYKPLHYVLIILLMLAPLRGVMAVQQSHCDMEDMPMSASANDSMSGHDMSGHAMHGMSPLEFTAVPVHMTADQPQTDQSTSNEQCCCCDSGCAANCDMSISASMVMNASAYSPVFINTSNSISYTSEILVRALTPPSRPPANLS